MVRRAAMVVSGTVLAMAAGACGDDSSGKPAANAAGTTADAGQAGASGTEQPGGGSGNAVGGQPDVQDEAGASAGGNDGNGASGGDPGQTSPDVNGQVLVGSASMANAIVVVNGVVTIADADGKFRVRRVAPEYQLMIRWPGEKAVFVYDGLTTRAPHVNVGAYAPKVERMATVRGAFVNGWDDVPADSRKVVSYTGAQPGYCDQDLYYPRTEFEIQPQWSGNASDEGEIYALQYLFDFDLGPYDYQGFGKRKLSLMDGQELGDTQGDAATDVTLSDPDDVSVSTSTTAPEGWTQDQSLLLLGPLRIEAAVPLDAGTLVVPDVGSPVVLQAYATGAEGSSVAQVKVDLKADLTVVHHLPPQQSSPEIDATGIQQDTEFFWDKMPADSVATLSLEVGDFTIFVHTAATSAKFPNLAPFHVKLPGQIAGTWTVTASGPATTMDEGLEIEESLNGKQPGNGFQSTGNRRKFVTGE